ncbi:WhiB family transcriptional regulator [Brachybacterium sp. p3-SID957]|uniref:WhiB family transcriptional regulator n=1 Tax=Brachybacterium TaxID=43668 RepID=UPI00223C13B2|nr:WhiB family transcriptional regulator [Brachybacterium sp. p3-SID957]MCT1776385.1 WhiB family transcriptional regulator [Brachybacterium sp. p3-SID957]
MTSSSTLAGLLPVSTAHTAAVTSLPCHDPEAADLFFAERPAELERAKALCSGCPLREACLEGALQRGEPWGVWGGQILEAGRVIAVKRGRGRPRKSAA